MVNNLRLFISTEAQSSSGHIISNIRNQIESRIGNIEVTNYTNDLDSIGIIINCFDKNFLSVGFGKTRKYISYKNRYADIRLNIPFEEFMEADKDKRIDMVKNNIYESIRIIDSKLNKKNGCKYDGERMISDIEEKLK